MWKIHKVIVFAAISTRWFDGSPDDSGDVALDEVLVLGISQQSELVCTRVTLALGWKKLSRGVQASSVSAFCTAGCCRWWISVWLIYRAICRLTRYMRVVVKGRDEGGDNSMSLPLTGSSFFFGKVMKSADGSPVVQLDVIYWFIFSFFGVKDAEVISWKLLTDVCSPPSTICVGYCMIITNDRIIVFKYCSEDICCLGHDRTF